MVLSSVANPHQRGPLPAARYFTTLEENCMTTFEKLKGIIVENFGVDADRITPEASISTDLDLDSLDEVELAIEIENDFEIEVSDEQIEASFTVGDLVKVIDTQLAAA
jgi:acyl carrier protein